MCFQKKEQNTRKYAYFAAGTLALVLAGGSQLTVLAEEQTDIVEETIVDTSQEEIESDQKNPDASIEQVVVDKEEEISEQSLSATVSAAPSTDIPDLEQMVNTANAKASELGLTKSNEWTIAEFICGSDLEYTPNEGESSSNAATQDLVEMLNANLPDNVNLVVLTGGTNLWHNNPGVEVTDGYVTPSGTSTQIWHIKNHKMNLIYDYGSYMDLSNADVLENFYKFAIDYAPADNMILGMWDHGAGPNKGAEYSLQPDGGDEGSHYMYFYELEKAVSNANSYRAQKQGIPKMDLFFYDNCLMNSVEIAYGMSGSAKYMVASEETEPSGGLNYEWLEAIGEDAFKNLSSDDEKDLYIAKRIVNLYPYRGTPGVDQSYEASNGGTDTMGIVDLGRMNDVMPYVEAFGQELNKIYDDKDKLMLLQRATRNLESMAEGHVAQLDIYVLATALANANLSEGLTTAANNLISVIGTPVIPEEGHGYVGEPASPGAVIYYGTYAPHSKGIGMSIFFPSQISMEDILLDAATGDNKYQFYYNGAYQKIESSKAAPSYMEFVKKLASETDASRTFEGKIAAELADDTNKVYMVVTEGNPIRIVDGIVDICADGIDSDNRYYLGQRQVSYDKENDQWSTERRKEWLTINGEPFTYFQKGNPLSKYNNMAYTMPAYIEFGETDKYKKGDIIPESEVYTLAIMSIMDDDTWFIYNVKSAGDDNYVVPKKDTYRFHPLLRIMNEDGSYGDFVVGDIVETTPSTSGYSEFVTSSGRPSDSPFYFTGYAFTAFDSNRNAFRAEPLYTLDIDENLVGLDEILDQQYTGSAIEPEATVSIAGYGGLSIEAFNLVFEDVYLRVSYLDNVEAGQATVRLEIVDKFTDAVIRTIDKNFNILKDVPQVTPTAAIQYAATVKSVPTASSSHLFGWISLQLMSLAGVITLLKRKKQF